MTPRGAGVRRMVQLLVAASLASTPILCFAQAWIGPAGEVSASATYQFSDYQGHLDQDGNKIQLGASRAQAVTIEVGYNVSDRLAVGLSIPYTATRNGKDPSPAAGHEGIDDGHYHAALQDYHFDVRYNVLMHPLVLTPFLTYVQPSHHYPTIGEAGAGRDLRETHIGLEVGRLLEPLAPSAYIDAHVGYVFSEKLLGIGTNRTVADLAAGYFVTPRFSPRVFGSYAKTHGGLTTDYVFGPDIPHDLFLEHDRLLRDTHLRVGVGASFAISSTLDLNAGYITTIQGTNTHYGHGMSIGISRTFAGPGTK